MPLDGWARIKTVPVPTVFSLFDQQYFAFNFWESFNIKQQLKLEKSC